MIRTGIGTTRPVLDPDSSVPLYDMFIDGEWIGSRRTMEQALDALSWRLWPSRRLTTTK